MSESAAGVLTLQECLNEKARCSYILMTCYCANLFEIGKIPESADLATDGSHVYVAWSTLSARTIVTIFAVSNDGANTFETPTVLGGINPSSVSVPTLALDRNNVYVSWGGAQVVFFRASHDNGKSFDQLLQLEDIGGFVYFPQVLASESKVYVLWVLEKPNFIYDAVARLSDDNGLSFHARTVAINGINDFLLVTALSGNKVHLAVGGLELTYAHN